MRRAGLGLRPGPRPGSSAHRPVTESSVILALGGKWSTMGFLMTLSSLWGPLAARIDSLCSSCTIRPANRLYVRGMRI